MKTEITANAVQTVGGKMSEAEMQAAMRSVEDENDAAAANQAEQETAAELAEFTSEPAQIVDHDDEKDGEAGDAG